jgi:uncharacterized membrane protein
MKHTGKHYFADKDIQIILGTLLRVGVIASMTVVFVGALIYLAVHHSDQVDYSKFDPSKSGYSSFYAIAQGLSKLDSRAIIQFGTILLIFTPVTRIVFSIFSFLIERDYLYVLIGLFVLCIILISLSNKLVG